MVFCFVQKFFFGQHKSQNIYFFVAQSAIFFLQNLTLSYMTKTVNQIFFSSTKIRIFFSAILGIRICFQKKTITHPPLKLNGRSLRKANSIFAALRRTFRNRTADIFLSLCKILVRTHLDYASSVWAPYKTKYIDIIESLQSKTNTRFSQSKLP